MRIMITGVSGLLGNNLARLALAQGHEVVGICRTDKSDRAFEGLDLQIHSVDLSDQPGLARAFEGNFDAVIHCAAHIHIGWKYREQAMRVNRDGTANVLAETKKKRTRLIHVSTVNTLAVGSKETLANEETAGDGQVPCTYVETKRAAEQLVVEAFQAGQDAVIVHPGLILGPWDWKPSSGRMIQRLNGFAPLAPSGGCTLCDARDVAEAILNSIHQGTSGRHYILGGENITYLQLCRKVCDLLGTRGPWTYMRAPGRIIGSAVGDWLSNLIGRELDVNSATIGMASQFHWYSSQRAIDELGYRRRPIDDSIRDAVQWLRQYQYIKQTKAK